MLVEDFHLTGTMSTIYNPDYYPRHMEALGFKKEVDWLQIRVNIPATVPARYARTAQYVREQVGLRVIKVSSKDIGLVCLTTPTSQYSDSRPCRRNRSTSL